MALDKRVAVDALVERLLDLFHLGLGGAAALGVEREAHLFQALEVDVGGADLGDPRAGGGKDLCLHALVQRGAQLADLVALLLALGIGNGNRGIGGRALGADGRLLHDGIVAWELGGVGSLHQREHACKV